MDFKVETRTFKEQKVMYIPTTLTHDEMLDTGRFFMKLGIHAFSEDGKPTGISFKRIINETESTIDLELCFEMEELIKETDEIKAKILPATQGKYAVAIHKGNRKDLPTVYVKMYEWFKEQGLTRTGGPLIEYYPNNAHQVPVADLITELLWPVE